MLGVSINGTERRLHPFPVESVVEKVLLKMGSRSTTRSTGSKHSVCK